MARRALFLDRDGTLIVDVGYPRDPERVELIEGAAEALAQLQRTWLLVVISNQSGIGRGMISPDEAAAVHARFIELFAQHGVTFASVHYCPHSPEAGCDCRKPRPGLIAEAVNALALDVRQSVMIGDKESDLECGLAAGCAGVFRFGGETSWPVLAEQLGSGAIHGV